jgi:hypothetical protein
VSVDSGAPLSTTVNGTTWCTDATVLLTDGVHSIVAVATGNAGFGSAGTAVDVDMAPGL